MSFDIEDFNEEQFKDSALENQQEPVAESLDVVDEEEKKYGFWAEILSWVLTILVAILLAVILKNYVIINATVPTESMENTILPEDRLIGNRLAYLFQGPQRGDIIIFEYPDNVEEKYIKRIIGLPGDLVTISDGKIYINGSEEPLEESYLKEEWLYGNDGLQYQVPEDSYFVMGDNRNRSWDSRYWKNTFVQREQIIGKAGVIYYPFTRMGGLD